MLNDPNKNHPEDTRNLIAFFLIAAVMYFAYHSLVLQPKQEAMRLQQQQAAQQAQVIEQEYIEPIARTDALTQGTAQRITIENSALKGSLSTKGGRIDDIALKDYFATLDKDEPQVLLSPEETKNPRYVDYGWVSKSETLALPTEDTVWNVSGNSNLSPQNPVTLTWINPQGISFARTYSIDDSYMISVTQKVTNTSAQNITLYPYALIAQKGMPEGYGGTRISHEGPTGFIGEDLVDPSYKDMRKGKAEKSVKASHGWLGFTDKFFMTSIIPTQGETMKYGFQYSGDIKDKDNRGQYQIDVVGEGVEINAGETVKTQTHLFAGAKEVITLKEYGDQYGMHNFDLAVDFGMLWFLSKPFFYMLHFFGELVGNMGVAIILLTALIRMSVFPLTNKSYASFAKMKKYAPQIAEIREQNSDDKATLQKKIMEFYQREGVNPMAGCFPIILQIPIFFALYKTLFVTIEIRHAPFFGWIQDLSAPDPTSVFNLFGLIPWDPPGFLMIGVWPCLMLLVMIVQKSLNPPPQDPLQRDIARFFPIMMAFILARFPAGLVVYWTFSALIGALQQMFIMRRMGVPIHLFGQSEAEEKIDEQLDNGITAQPLTKMVKDDVKDALLDNDDDDAPPTISPPTKKKRSKKRGKK